MKVKVSGPAQIVAELDPTVRKWMPKILTIIAINCTIIAICIYIYTSQAKELYTNIKKA